MKKSLFDLPKTEGPIIRHDLAVWMKTGDGAAFRVAWIEKARDVGYHIKRQGDPESPIRLLGRWDYLEDAEKQLSRVARKLKKELS